MGNERLFCNFEQLHLTIKLKKRKVLIVLSLVDESNSQTNEDLEREIKEELSDTFIPWCRRIDRVRIIEDNANSDFGVDH